MRWPHALALGLLLGLLAAPAQAQAPAEILPPVLEHEPPAEYPPAMADRGLRAEVVAELEVGEDGRVRKVAITQSGGPDFDAAATAAAQGLRFRPATQAGKPLAVRIQYRWRFEPPILRRDSAGLEGFDRRPVVTAPEGFESLRGQVLERGTGRPVVSALVVLPGLDEEVATDADGRFTFGLLPPGSHALEIRSVEHALTKAKAPVVAGRTTQVLLRAERLSYVVYRATAVAPPAAGEVARRSLKVEEIQKIPGVYGDAFKVVQNLPGVARAPGLSGEIIVRGSGPQDSQVNIEGVRVPLLYHFGSLYSVINTDLLETIDFFPGGYGVRHGRRTGGLVEAKLKVPQPDDRVTGYVESNVFHTGAFLRASSGDTSISLAARRSYIDFVLNAVVPDGALPFTLAPRYWDYQLAVDHVLSKRMDLTVLALGSDDGLRLVLDRPPAGFPDAAGELETSTGFHGAIGLFRLRGDGWQTRTTAGLVRTGVNFGLGTAFRIEGKSLEWTLRQDLTVGEGPVVLRAGLDTYHIPFEASVLLPQQAATEGEGAEAEAGRRQFSLKSAVFAPALWFDTVFRVHPRLEVVPGLRLDLYRDAANGETLLPRLNVRWQVEPGLVVKGASGFLSQSPEPEQLIPRFGNPDLVPIRSWEAAAGVEYQLSDVFELDVQAFTKQIWRLPVQPAGPLPTIGQVSAGRGTIHGLELLLRHPPVGRFFGWLAYTLQQATRRDHPDEPDHPFEWDQTHILTAVGSYKLPANFELGARFRLVSGNPITEVSTAVWNDSWGGYERQPSGCLNCGRLPAFHQLDLRLDKKWVYDRLLVNAYLDVQNVYNRSNPEDVQYNYDATLEAYRSGLPIIPSFGVKIEF